MSALVSERPDGQDRRFAGAWVRHRPDPAIARQRRHGPDLAQQTGISAWTSLQRLRRLRGRGGLGRKFAMNYGGQVARAWT